MHLKQQAMLIQYLKQGFYNSIMKKYIAIIAIMLFSVTAFAQSRGRVQTIATDSLKGNNSSVLATIPITGSYESMFIEIAATRVSTAAGGVFYLHAGLSETTAQEVNSSNSSVEFMVNDTMTTADVATQYFNILIVNPGSSKYFIYGDGDANDTLKVVTKILLK